MPGNSGWLLLFVFVNWGIEARKWQLLMKAVQPMSFITAFKSVLCGVTLSLNTPNRMGEYGGRILFVKEGNRIKAIALIHCRRYGAINNNHADGMLSV